MSIEVLCLVRGKGTSKQDEIQEKKIQKVKGREAMREEK
jgi:hypothetical protein